MSADEKEDESAEGEKTQIGSPRLDAGKDSASVLQCAIGYLNALICHANILLSVSAPVCLPESIPVDDLAEWNLFEELESLLARLQSFGALAQSCLLIFSHF